MIDIKILQYLIENKRREDYPGRQLYYYKPTKKPTKIDVYSRGKVHTKHLENTQEVYTNWFNILVNQKLDYSLSKKPTVSEFPPEFDIEEILSVCPLNSSIDSRTWIHLFINKNKKLDWINVLDNECIAIYDNKNKELETLIRFFKKQKKLENILDSTKEKLIVQIWTIDKLEEIEIDDTEREWQVTGYCEMSHYFKNEIYNQKVKKTINENFGFIPFVPLFNNKNKVADSDNIEILCEIYNEIATGFVSNVRKFQETIYKLKGFGGENLKEFTEKLRKYLAVDVGEDGDIEPVKIEIPVEARSELLKLCKENIFILGRGVDPTFNFSGKDITNVFIKSFYSPLSNKSLDMEQQIRLFLKELAEKISKYYNTSIESDIEFNRNQIFNESEQIDNCMKSLNIVSLRTVLEQHPFVSDVDEELKRLDEEKKKNEEDFKNSMHENDDFGGKLNEQRRKEEQT